MDKTRRNEAGAPAGGGGSVLPYPPNWRGAARAALMRSVHAACGVDLRPYLPQAVWAAVAERLRMLGLPEHTPDAYLQRLQSVPGAAVEAYRLLGVIERRAWAEVANPLADAVSANTLQAALPLLGARPGRDPALAVWLPACPDPAPIQLLAQWLDRAVRATAPALSALALQPPPVDAAAAARAHGWQLQVSSACWPVTQGAGRLDAPAPVAGADRPHRQVSASSTEDDSAAGDGIPDELEDGLPDLPLDPLSDVWPIQRYLHRVLVDPPLVGCDLLITHGLLAPLRPGAQRRLLRRLLPRLRPHAIVWLAEPMRGLAAEFGLAPLGRSLLFRSAGAADLGSSPRRDRVPAAAPAQDAVLLRSLVQVGTGALLLFEPERMAELELAMGEAAVAGALQAARGRWTQELLQTGSPQPPSALPSAPTLAAGSDLAPVTGLLRGSRGPARVLWAVLPGVTQAEAAGERAQRLLRILGGPLPEVGALRLVWNVGVACFDLGPGTQAAGGPGAAQERAIRQAQATLEAAHRQARGVVEVCSPRLQQHFDARALVWTELPSAVARGDLQLFYQPQFAVADGRLIGVEALVRWRHPQRGLLLPEAFIGSAEDAGMIDELGRWVLNEACAQARSWTLMGLPPVPMAVNVSVLQLRQPDFLDQVRSALAAADLPPERLELELTESALLQGRKAVSDLLADCRHLGVRISLDDFGTGHSSLALLHRIGVDRLKIDRQFIAGLPTDVKAAAIARAVIRLAEELGIEAVAEGVETTDQLELLRQWGCHGFQGHLRAGALEVPLAQQHLGLSPPAR